MAEVGEITRGMLSRHRVWNKNLLCILVRYHHSLEFSRYAKALFRDRHPLLPIRTRLKMRNAWVAEVRHGFRSIRHPLTPRPFPSLANFRLYTPLINLFVQTVDSLVAASNLPLSVVIVGVGQADFSVSVGVFLFFAAFCWGYVVATESGVVVLALLVPSRG